MGYFKTLMVDASAARGYQQRYDRLTHNDQVGNYTVDAHLVTDHRTMAPATPSTVAQSADITREAVGKALRTWRARVQHSPRDLNALNRATLNIEATVWYWHDDTLIITSASTSRTRYHVTATSCECRAAASGFACWHRWAWTVLDSARRPVASEQPVQRVTDDVQRLVDELF